MLNDYKFIDFCAGIGSAHFALKALGLECAGYSEIEPNAIKIYQKFHGESYKNFGDLMKINPLNLPDFDILCAGFPCQTFSIVGKRQGFEDDRGQIIYGLSEILTIKQPKAFLLENVKGLVNLDKGQALKNIIMLLNKAGYEVFHKVLESTGFGIPQKRERIYLVGIRRDLFFDDFTFPEPQKQIFDLKHFLVDENKSFIMQEYSAPYQTFLKYLENKYNVGKFNLSELLAEDYLVLDTRQSDLRLYRHEVPTIRTGRQGILYVRDGKLRRLSGREALLLQGFEDKYAILGSEYFLQSKILATAGNAMTVNVMEAIGRAMMEYLGERVRMVA